MTANDLGPWFLAYTLNHGNNELTDHFSIHADEQHARRAYLDALDQLDPHCACIGPIRTATEPHWTEKGAIY